jgi:hypothetical protein
MPIAREIQTLKGSPLIKVEARKSFARGVAVTPLMNRQ